MVEIFDSREDVIIWICANQSARRNITPEQKAYLLGKRYEAEKKKQAGNPTGRNQYTEECHQSDDIPTGPNRTARRIANELGIGQASVERAGQFARAVDTLAADQARSRIKGMCSTPTPSLC